MRLVGLGVWFALRVREVPGSNPGRAHVLLREVKCLQCLKNLSKCASFYQYFILKVNRRDFLMVSVRIEQQRYILKFYLNLRSNKSLKVIRWRRILREILGYILDWNGCLSIYFRFFRYFRLSGTIDSPLKGHPKPLTMTSKRVWAH